MSYDHAAEQHKRHLANHADAYLDGTVWRWATNNSCPFDDMLASWVTAGLCTPAQAAATSAARDEDTTAFLAAYRAAQPATPSADERAQARAAHGPGQTVVDVLTGRTYTT